MKLSDIKELINRIYEYGTVYKYADIKPPLFKLTPYEYQILTEYISTSFQNCAPEYFGDVPTFMGVDFQLVGKPVLFGGLHIRSDSGIEIQKQKESKLTIEDWTQKFQKLFNQKSDEFSKEISKCKEEILLAFMAKYGLQPNEVAACFSPGKFWVEKAKRVKVEDIKRLIHELKDDQETLLEFYKKINKQDSEQFFQVEGALKELNCLILEIKGLENEVQNS